MVSINIDDVQVRINMLGGFAIATGENRVTEQVKKSSKYWKLLQYLIAHRHKAVSHEELIEVFCDSEQMLNPDNALRTMVYRARSVLSRGGIYCAESMILSTNGGYIWNNAVACEVDAEEFESLCKKASAKTEDDERLDLFLQAVALYRGDFLPSSAGDLWVMPLARWYRSMYLSCAHAASELLLAKDRNAEAEEICVKALRIDQFDETLLAFHLRALIAQGKYAQALDTYVKMEEMFYDVLGVHFSDNLRSLYNQIQKPLQKDGVPLDAVLADWLDGADSPGAYYCDLSIFKTIYQIESRSLSRSGRSAYVVWFDTKHEPGTKNGGVMKQLGVAIPGSLRMGDLYTRASPSQYILMLHSLTYEDCKSLVNRIMCSVDSRYLPKIISISIRPIVPITQ
ncbi:MAG: winged helix-turn-helix domain-containing protein [Oscillospiraceae bacterium]|nr:winged helix-turn-helix domain-containing protein [Oscillospiraceae bacterium]